MNSRDPVTYQNLTAAASRVRSSKSNSRREVVFYILASLGLLLIGTVGYSVIEGWQLFDSLYMTVITVGAVGFQEVHPLSFQGRIFTMGLIIVGLVLVTAVVSSVAQNVISTQFMRAMERDNSTDIIRKLSGHTILCGFGRLARIAASQLRQEGHPLLIVDKEPSRVSEAREAGYLVIEGDATTDETLETAGIRRAKRLVSLLPKDSDNLYVILTSRELNSSLFLLSRAEDEAGEKRLQRAGADKIISPYRVGGQKIAAGLVRPFVTDFLDLAASSSGGHLQIEEIRIPEGSPLAGLTLQSAALRQKSNVIVAAVIGRSGEMQFNPAASTVIEAGSTFIALGSRADLAELENILLQR